MPQRLQSLNNADNATPLQHLNVTTPWPLKALISTPSHLYWWTQCFNRASASTIPPQQLTTLTSTPQSLNIWLHQVFIPQHLTCSMLWALYTSGCQTLHAYNSDSCQLATRPFASITLTLHADTPLSCYSCLHSHSGNSGGERVHALSWTAHSYRF